MQVRFVNVLYFITDVYPYEFLLIFLFSAYPSSRYISYCVEQQKNRFSLFYFEDSSLIQNGSNDDSAVLWVKRYSINYLILQNLICNCPLTLMNWLHRFYSID